MIAPFSGAPAPEPNLPRILDALQDALVQLEVWRQHAREAEEWSALRRLATALGAAQEEVAECGALPERSTDDAQQSLLPP